MTEIRIWEEFAVQEVILKVAKAWIQIASEVETELSWGKEGPELQSSPSILFYALQSVEAQETS